MTKAKRPPIPPTIRKNILTKNLGVCCVCKERGLGTNFHHIDGKPENNDEDNIALLCVQEHDQHHRPKSYDNSKHLELGTTKIKRHKREWEQTVKECQSNNPKILAVVNAFGDFDNIHSVKVIIQDQKGKIIYERLYHQHRGTMDEWTDEIMEEVIWLGNKVPLTLIDKPLNIELCPCCRISFSNTLDNNVAIRLTAKDWKQKSLGSIFINPATPSLAMAVLYKDKPIFSASLHKCNKHLHLMCDKYEERTSIKKGESVRKQATELFQRVCDAWQPGQFLIRTGNHDNPTVINEFKLPKTWEK